MPSTNRRQFLGAAGVALLGVAGCVGDLSNGTTDGTSASTSTSTDPSATDGTSTTTATPVSSERALGGVVVGVTMPTVRKAVAYQSIMGSGGVLVPDDQQFVVAAVESGKQSRTDATGDPPYEGFDLVVDDETYPAVDVEDRTTGAYTTSLAGRGQVRYAAPYASGRDVGWVAFELPSPVDASDAAIRCQHDGETAEWSLSDDQVAALSRRAPTFELRSFETTVDGPTVDLSLVVENVSETDGRFLAAVYWPTERIADDDESTIVDRSVAAGDRVEWTKTFDTKYAAGQDGTVTASVDGPVSAERTLELGTETTTGN